MGIQLQLIKSSALPPHTGVPAPPQDRQKDWNASTITAAHQNLDQTVNEIAKPESPQVQAKVNFETAEGELRDWDALRHLQETLCRVAC